MRMTGLMLSLLGVFGGQGVMAWLFYRSRAVSHASWTDSDLVVFGLPLAIGFLVSASTMFSSAFPRSPASMRTLTILGVSAVGAVISSYIGAAIGFNLYGT
jgi:hypothetical protein